MSTTRTAAIVAAAALALGPALAAPIAAGATSSPTTDAPARPAAVKIVKYKNCTALNKKHPHGVGKPGARDKSSRTPVTSFLRNAKLYAANKHLDRDKDGIACEKK